MSLHGADKTDRAAMAEIYAGSAQVECSLCKSPQGWPTSGLCTRCWELDFRIRHDPELAEEVLRRIKQEAVSCLS